MNIEKLKVISEVLLQELNIESDNACDYSVPTSFKLRDKLCNKIIMPDILNNVIDSIKKKAQEQMKNNSAIKKILFKMLLVVYLNTTQHQRFLHLNDLLEHFYNKLVQKLIELKRFKELLIDEDYYEIVNKMTPLVKFHVVKGMSEREKADDEKLKVSLMELYETELYTNISREDCYDIIRNKMNNQDDVKFLDYDIKPVDTKNGFLGDYFNIKIHITVKDKVEINHFFLKHMPLNSDELRQSMAEMSFKKEQLFYTRLIPYLKKFGCTEVTDFLPCCYLTRKNRFMVFDDFSAIEFSNLDLEIPFTYEQLSLILKQLSKMNSCGPIFEEKISEILGINFRLNKYYGDMLVETFAIRNHRPTESFFQCQIRTNNYTLDKFSHLFKPETLEMFKQKCSVAFNRYYDIAESSKTIRNFVTHGDLWCNNILFDKNRSYCKLVDFQIIRYNLPSHDVYFLLATNTDFKTRMKYGLRLMDEYYSNLKCNLSRYNVNIENILTRDQFLKSVEEVKTTSLTVALSYLLLLLLPKEKMTHIFEDPELSENFFTKDRTKIMDELWDGLKCKSRFEELIQELYILLNEK